MIIFADSDAFYAWLPSPPAWRRIRPPEIFDLTAGSPARRRDPPSALSSEGALVV
jgi:hypothetical protein